MRACPAWSLCCARQRTKRARPVPTTQADINGKCRKQLNAASAASAAGGSARAATNKRRLSTGAAAEDAALVAEITQGQAQLLGWAEEKVRVRAVGVCVAHVRRRRPHVVSGLCPDTHHVAARASTQQMHIAFQVYDLVDKHIRELDDDLKGFASEVGALGGLGSVQWRVGVSQ